MLSLRLRTGEYMTIGGSVVVQLNQISGDRCQLTVEAPREMAVLRGEVLEKNGGERPSCVLDIPERKRGEAFWSREKTRTLTAMRSLLREMDGEDADVRTLRRQLDELFPPEFGSRGVTAAPERKVSNV